MTFGPQKSLSGFLVMMIYHGVGDGNKFQWEKLGL